jgi:Phage portal protein, SPP1 Gp6-like
MPTADELVKQLNALFPVLDKRGKVHRTLEGYYTGACPLPKAVVQARVTRAYKMLMPMAEAPWGSRVVDSVQDRLEVSGIRSPDDQTAIDEALWGVWQDNQMDSESKLAHNAALISGRAFALIQPVEGKSPEISLDTAEQMIVQYREGSRRHRVAAMRRWEDDDERCYATLYRPDGVFKFIKSTDQTLGDDRFKVNGEFWEPRDEDWQQPNPLGVVPVVELTVNRRLKPGSYGYARGEYAHCTGLLDRINLLTFLGLVVAFWQGFPLRAVTGQRIAWDFLVDDDGEPLLDASTGEQRKRARPPFDALADTVAQLEDPAAKLQEFTAADRANLGINPELDQLSTITGTPRHYFPLSQGMSNLSADAIRASEGSLAAKVVGHKGTLGEGHEEILRVSGLALPDPVYLSPRAELLWQDHEARSMAERADAAVKLDGILPRQVLWQRYLNATAEDTTRWEAMMMSDVLATLMAQASAPQAPAAPADEQNAAVPSAA